MRNLFQPTWGIQTTHGCLCPWHLVLSAGRVYLTPQHLILQSTLFWSWKMLLYTPCLNSSKQKVMLPLQMLPRFMDYTSANTGQGHCFGVQRGFERCESMLLRESTNTLTCQISPFKLA